MKIAIDAGHGLYTAGKRCSKEYDPNETREWVLNSRVAQKVISLLKEYKDVEIIRIDDPTGQTDVGLTERCNKANNARSDIYVSIHHNAGGGVGIETFCHPSQDDYSEAYRLATLVQKYLIEETHQVNRGVKRYDFAVCRETNMPAILTELGFMDNAIDTPKILTDIYNTECAKGIVKGIAEYGNLKKEAKDGWVTENGNTYYYKDGEKVKGWFDDGKGTYWYFDKDTGIMRKGWLDDGKGNHWYFDKTSGQMKKGWFSDGKGATWYFSKTSGQMLKGLHKIDGKLYYFDEKSGQLAKDKWVSVKTNPDGTIG